jgi:hypothetical protein
MSGKTTPLYVVCSPRRRGGKTLVSRLLTEFYVLGDQPVAAFDLCDEGPQLADYLPKFTTIADINDIRGQMAFFERLIAEDGGAKVIDLSHRIFKNFFTTVQEIGFFEEAHRHSIAPLILFVIDMHPKSSEICATIRRWLPEASLLPVRNVAKGIAISAPDALPKDRAAPASLDVPFLRLSLRTLIDGQNFSFSEFWRAKSTNLPDALDHELLDWVAGVFFQFRDIELSLGCEDSWTRIAAPVSRRARTAHPVQQGDAQPLGSVRGNAESAAMTQDAINVSEEIRKFAPKKVRRGGRMDQSGHELVNKAGKSAAINHDTIGVPEEIRKFAQKKGRRGAPMDQSGNDLITMLQKTTFQLKTAEDRISALEIAIKQWQDRAALAQTQLLQNIQDQIKRRAE